MADKVEYKGVTWIDDRTAKFDDIEDATIVFAEKEKPGVVKTVLEMLVRSVVNRQP